MSENIALDKKQQSKFARKVKKAKERVKLSGNITEETTNKRPKRPHGLVYVGHIPHGFYENEMLAYFKQFGRISNLRVCRSRATGQSKGYAFVEFSDAEVAKIAAETMDNYLMFNRRLIAKYIPIQQQSKRRYMGPSWSKTSCPLQINRKKAILLKNKNIDETTHLKKSKQIVSLVNKSLKKLHELGISYSFRAVDDHNNLNKNIIVPNASNIKPGVGTDNEIKGSTQKKSKKRVSKKKNIIKGD